MEDNLKKFEVKNKGEIFDAVESITIERNSRSINWSFKLIGRQMDLPEELERVKALKKQLELLCTIDKVREKIEVAKHEELEA